MEDLNSHYVPAPLPTSPPGPPPPSHYSHPSFLSSFFFGLGRKYPWRWGVLSGSEPGRWFAGLLRSQLALCKERKSEKKREQGHYQSTHGQGAREQGAHRLENQG